MGKKKNPFAAFKDVKEEEALEEEEIEQIIEEEKEEELEILSSLEMRTDESVRIEDQLDDVY